MVAIAAVALVSAVVAWVASARAREEAYRRQIRWRLRRGME